MSVKVIERELTELKRRIERLKTARIKPEQGWRQVIGIFENDDLAREAGKRGAAWRAKENKRR